MVEEGLEETNLSETQFEVDIRKEVSEIKTRLEEVTKTTPPILG